MSFLFDNERLNKDFDLTAAFSANGNALEILLTKYLTNLFLPEFDQF